MWWTFILCCQRTGKIALCHTEISVLMTAVTVLEGNDSPKMGSGGLGAVTGQETELIGGSVSKSTGINRKWRCHNTQAHVDSRQYITLVQFLKPSRKESPLCSLAISSPYAEDAQRLKAVYLAMFGSIQLHKKVRTGSWGSYKGSPSQSINLHPALLSLHIFSHPGSEFAPNPPHH